MLTPAALLTSFPEGAIQDRRLELHRQKPGKNYKGLNQCWGLEGRRVLWTES